MARYEDVKARSLTGLAHVVDTRTKLVLDIRIAPLTIVISENGIFSEEKRNLIADLGLLTITTMEDDSVVETSLLGDEVSFIFISVWYEHDCLIISALLQYDSFSTVFALNDGRNLYFCSSLIFITSNGMK